jgi:hypothetical protein
MGVEPTTRPAKERIAGFEDREDHRTPFASARIIEIPAPPRKRLRRISRFSMFALALVHEPCSQFWQCPSIAHLIIGSRSARADLTVGHELPHLALANQQRFERIAQRH